jgi:hypothetical protein
MRRHTQAHEHTAACTCNSTNGGTDSKCTRRRASAEAAVFGPGASMCSSSSECTWMRRSFSTQRHSGLTICTDRSMRRAEARKIRTATGAQQTQTSTPRVPKLSAKSCDRIQTSCGIARQGQHEPLEPARPLGRKRRSIGTANGGSAHKTCLLDKICQRCLNAKTNKVKSAQHTSSGLTAMACNSAGSTLRNP